MAKADEPENRAIQELQNQRAAGLPREITASDRTYALLEQLGDGSNKAAAAGELINWLFVKEPEPGTTEPFGLLTLHPAARSLIALGDSSAPLLKAKLQETLSEEDAELIMTCLKHILKSQASEKIREIEDQASSANIKQAAEAVLQRKEKKFDSMTYRLQQRASDQRNP